MSRHEALPSTSEIVAFLREGCGDFVVKMPERVRHQPEEIWLPGLGCWVRADGFSICGDCGRGYAYPNTLSRWRIKQAVKRFRELEARFPATSPQAHLRAEGETP